MDIAEEGLEALSEHVDSLIIILNEKLEEIYEDDSMIEWLQHADDVLNNAVAGIAEIINVPGHINVDFNDVKTIMGEQGKAMMGTATASGVDRARIAAEQAVASPLLDGIDLSGARGVLVNVTASRGLKGKEIKEVMATVRAFAAPDASIAQGIAYDDEMGDDIRVTVVNPLQTRCAHWKRTVWKLTTSLPSCASRRTKQADCKPIASRRIPVARLGDVVSLAAKNAGTGHTSGFTPRQ
jgi:cell division protein FtsZ